MIRPLTIEAVGIGDDEDYGVFVCQVTFNLWRAGHLVQAFKLANTILDISDHYTAVEFEAHMNKIAALHAEQEATTNASYMGVD